MEETNSSRAGSEVNPAKLFVGNLSWSVRDDDLLDLFSQYGNVLEAKVVMDRFNPTRSKGIAFVEFDTAEAAQAAIEALNETEFFERKILVNVSQPPKRDGFNRGGGNRGNFGGGGYRGGRDNDRRGGYGRDNRGGGRRNSY